MEMKWGSIEQIGTSPYDTVKFYENHVFEELYREMIKK